MMNKAELQFVSNSTDEVEIYGISEHCYKVRKLALPNKNRSWEVDDIFFFNDLPLYISILRPPGYVFYPLTGIKSTPWTQKSIIGHCKLTPWTRKFFKISSIPGQYIFDARSTVFFLEKPYIYIQEMVQKQK